MAEILATRAELVRAASPPESVSWQEAMRRAIRGSRELRERLGLPEPRRPVPLAVPPTAANDPATDQIEAAEADFPTFVPLEFLARMRPGDPRDPLLLQVLATPEETLDVPGFTADPVGDQSARVATGLLQKYHGRALAMPTGVCGVHCRYCFRRQFDYSAATDSASGTDPATWAPLLDHLRRSPEIEEVILSGGDPLTLADPKLDRLLDAIESIDHVRRLRIHSRMPIVIPQRVTSGLVERLRASRLTTWLVVHSNHPNEIDAEVAAAVGRLVDAGIPVLNQAVLLAGVNDDAETLESLCRRWIDLRVQPYYLHQLDRVAGAAHFEVPVERGRELIAAIRARLPGYAVPTYVSEITGAAAKVPNHA